MKKFITILSVATLAIFSANSFAGGPDKGNGKDKKQLEQHERMQQMDAEERRELKQQHKRQKPDDDSDGKGKKLREYQHEREHDPQGLDKQRDKKMYQERKELGKGSEQGQASREEHSRKWWQFGDADQGDDSRRQWWKFWGDDE